MREELTEGYMNMSYNLFYIFETFINSQSSIVVFHLDQCNKHESASDKYDDWILIKLLNDEIFQRNHRKWRLWIPLIILCGIRLLISGLLESELESDHISGHGNGSASQASIENYATSNRVARTHSNAVVRLCQGRQLKPNALKRPPKKTTMSF